MSKDHDWQELAAAMCNYAIAVPSLQKDWNNLTMHFIKRTDLSTDAATIAELIDRFIQDNEDAPIYLLDPTKEVWNLQLTGTGNPNKKQKKSRGSTTTIMSLAS
jgi:hypothetical protein